MSVKGKKIAVLVNNYFEESELTVPSKILEEKGAVVTIIATSKKLRSMKGPEPGREFKPDVLLKDARSRDYDCLLLPGGIINAIALRINKKARKWASDFIDSRKPLAASGYASLLLVSADLLEERQLTSPPEISDDISNAGGEWTDRAVVMDGNLITSRDAGEVRTLSNKIIEWYS